LKWYLPRGTRLTCTPGIHGQHTEERRMGGRQTEGNEPEGSLESSFRYQIGGGLVPIPEPFTLDEITHDDWELGKVVERINFGQYAGIQLRVIHNSDDLANIWWLVIGVFPRVCFIEVIGWPALLDALTRYAPMVNMESIDWIRVVSEQYEKNP
jgi:hypothetical protein